MHRFDRFLHRATGRAASLVLGLLLSWFGAPGCGSVGGILPAASGLPEYQSLVAISVPGARVNVAGGNLWLRRVDLSLDTRLGSQELAATYNSASGSWRWSFDLRYDGAEFTDGTGARWEIAGLPPGSAIPGSGWVKIDTAALRTKGGLVHRFDGAGRLESIHWASSAYPRIEYLEGIVAGAPRTTAIRQCVAPGDCSELFALVYDSAGRLVEASDRAGRRAEFTHDGEGRLVQARDGLDTVRGWPGFRYEYEGDELTAVTNSEGERILYIYSNGRIREVRRIGETNPRIRFSYQPKNEAGLYRTRVWDPRGFETVYRWDAERRLRERETIASGELTRRTWQGLRVASWVQPSGVTTAWTYVGDDVATRVEPSGNTTHYLYEPEAVDRQRLFARPIREVWDGLGLRERRSYDGQGRLVTIENGVGETTLFLYGPDEMLQQMTPPNGVPRFYADYGEHGHPAVVTVGGVPSARVFDAVGNLLEGSEEAETDRGGIVARAFDEDRNLVALSVRDLVTPISATPEGASTRGDTITVEYRSDGRWTAVRRPGGGDHERSYDALGRLREQRERVDGLWQVTQIEVDAAGRETARTLANGMRRETAYDAAGRIAATRSLRWGVEEATASFGYAEGRLTSLSDSARGGIETYSYDPAGRLAGVIFPDGEMQTLEYDQRSRRAAESYWLPGGILLRRLEFAYDLADRPVRLDDDSTPILTRAYESGRLASIDYGNGLRRNFYYDSLSGFPASTITQNANGDTLERTHLGYTSPWSEYPWIFSETILEGWLAGATGTAFTLGPGPEDSHPQAGPRASGSFGLNNATAYSYDVLSNLTRVEVQDSESVAHDFVYNSEGNRLLRVEDAASGALVHDYDYDEAGYVTVRDGQAFAWTAGGRIAAIGSNLEFEWDALNRPVSCTAAGIRTRWLFGGQVEADASAVPRAIDRGDVRIALDGSGRRYRHFDFRGNVVLVSDSNGDIVTHYEYSAYGLATLYGDAGDRVRFLARPQFGELMLLGARVYDPGVGRFLAPDPLFALLNQYSYTFGDPILLSDPTGAASEADLQLYLSLLAIGFGAAGGIAGAVGAPTFVVIGLTVTAASFAAAAAFQAYSASAFSLEISGASFAYSGAGVAIAGAGPLGSVTGAVGSTAGGAGTGGSSSGGAGGAASAAGSSGAGNGGAGGGGGGAIGCAPTDLPAVPNLGWLLAVLVPLQLLLGAWVLRRRERR